MSKRLWRHPFKPRSYLNASLSFAERSANGRPLSLALHLSPPQLSNPLAGWFPSKTKPCHWPEASTAAAILSAYTGGRAAAATSHCTGLASCSCQPEETGTSHFPIKPRGRSLSLYFEEAGALEPSSCGVNTGQEYYTSATVFFGSGQYKLSSLVRPFVPLTTAWLRIGVSRQGIVRGRPLSSLHLIELPRSQSRRAP
jgi:hypothetical protein